MRRRLRVLGLAAGLLLALGAMASAGAMLTGVSPPVVTAIMPTELGAFTVPVAVGLTASSLVLMAVIAAQIEGAHTIKSRLRVSFAMSAFARHVLQPGLGLFALVPALKHDITATTLIATVRRQATATVQLVSEIPDRIATAIGRERGGLRTRTHLELAVSQN